jgi:hypothetical protein
MIIAVIFFWESGGDILVIASYPYLTKLIMMMLKGAHYGIMFVMVLKNPGVMSSHDYFIGSDIKDEETYRKTRPCEPCRVISHKAEHCFRCQVCFENVDHHCPWMNKCVAKGNLVEFYLFLALTFGSLFYALGISVMLL